MIRPAHRAIRLLAPLMAAILVVGATPALSAAAAPSTGGGFSQKAALQTSGRAVVAADALPVKDGTAPAAAGTTYYVDSVAGDDSAAGTSVAAPWRSLAKLSATVFQPGDRILLKAGSEWAASGNTVAKEAYDYTAWSGSVATDVVGPVATALLAPKGSGTALAPIVLSSYGTGSAPKLEGRGVVNDTLQLTNQQHWDISNLDISNITDGFDPSNFVPGANEGVLPGEENPKTGDLRGIHVQAASAGKLSGFAIHGVYVHDVSGVIWSITSAGLDRAKRTGGILFEGLKGDAHTASQFSDVTISDSVVANTSFANIGFKQFSGMGTNRYADVKPGWGDRAVATASTTGVIKEDPDWAPHTNIEVSDNYLTNRDTDYGWDSVYLTSVQDATVEGNLVDGAGVSGIELGYADNVIVQNNEVTQITTRDNAADTNAIDPDRGTSNVLIQWNYIHDAGEGILLCGFSFGTSVVRYNVIQDVTRNYINPHGDSGVNVIYDNLMYNTLAPSSGVIGFFNSSGGNTAYLTAKNRHVLLNNVFVNTRSTVTGATIGAAFPGVTVDHNAYYGSKVTAPATDVAAVTSDPQLGGEPADSITDVAPESSASPLIVSGAVVDLATIVPGFAVTGNTGTSQTTPTADFLGRALSTPPTIGAASYEPTDGHGLLAGFVVDQAGVPVPNAHVTVGSQTLTSDASGRYVLDTVAGDYSLVPTAAGYTDGASVAATVSSGATVRRDLALGVTTATTGSVTGTVTSGSQPVPGADVTLSKDSSTVDTTTTDATGKYTFASVDAASGYSVTASKTGYDTATTSSVTVAAARVATGNIVLPRHVGETSYAIDETFDDETTGAFTQTTDGVLKALTSSTGTVSIADDPQASGNKYLRIAKTSAGAGVLGAYNATSTNLTGTVTIESRLQRTTTNGAPNQVAMYSYTDANWNGAAPASSTNPSATFGFSTGKLITHSPGSTVKNIQNYTVGQWYTVREVVNLDAETFDLYVDDMNTPVLTDQPLRTSVPDLDRFLFFVNGSNVGDILVDYFRVNTGTPYNYDDASLSQVSAQSEGTALDLTASDDGTVYAGSADPFADSAAVTVGTGSAFAGLTVNGKSVASGASVDVPLASGSEGDDVLVTTVPVIVTAESGSTKHYAISISRTNPSQLAQLRDLSIDGNAFDPAFEPSRVGSDDPYAVSETVDSSVQSITVRWETGWAGQHVQVNGEDEAAGATSATVDLVDGVNTIDVSADSYPGDSATYVVTVVRAAPVDSAAPSVSLTPTPAQADGSNGWYRGSVNLAVTASDAVDPAPVSEAAIDGGDWQVVNGPVAISGDGEHHVNVRATDASGNVSMTESWSGRIDATSPVSIASTDAADRSVTIASQDATSGVARIEVKVGDNDWSTYGGAVAVGSGQTTVQFRGVDNAGNVESAGRAIVPSADTVLTQPTLVATIAHPSTHYYDANSITVRVTGAATGATGTARVVDGATLVGTATVSKGKARLQLARGLKPGKHSLRVIYSGDVTYAPGSKGIALRVVKAASTTKASFVDRTITKSTKPKLKVTVKSSAPVTGRAAVKEGKKTLKGSLTVVKGKATIVLPKLARGKHKITVYFAGSSTVASSHPIMEKLSVR